MEWVTDTVPLVQNGKFSDSFARHFAQRFSLKPSPQQQRDIMKFEIISSVNPISAMKTFGKHECTLCMGERLNILKFVRKRSSLLGNLRSVSSQNEISQVCQTLMIHTIDEREPFTGF